MTIINEKFQRKKISDFLPWLIHLLTENIWSELMVTMAGRLLFCWTLAAIWITATPGVMANVRNIPAGTNGNYYSTSFSQRNQPVLLVCNLQVGESSSLPYIESSSLPYIESSSLPYIESIHIFNEYSQHHLNQFYLPLMKKYTIYTLVKSMLTFMWFFFLWDLKKKMQGYPQIN